MVGGIVKGVEVKVQVSFIIPYGATVSKGGPRGVPVGRVPL